MNGWIFKKFFYSEKSFNCKTNTGRVEVPATTFGGKCEITTTSGDIRVKISD